MVTVRLSHGHGQAQCTSSIWIPPVTFLLVSTQCPRDPQNLNRLGSAGLPWSSEATSLLGMPGLLSSHKDCEPPATDSMSKETVSLWTRDSPRGLCAELQVRGLGPSKRRAHAPLRANHTDAGN